MISMTPLVQRSPEEAAAHSAGNPTSTGYDGGDHREPGYQPAAPSFEAGTHAAPPLPPTTFAEAQFGEAPSAAAVFASTADMPPSAGAFHAPPSDAPSAFTGSAFSKAPAPATPAAAEPVAYTEPIPGWSDAPVAAPPGWATAVPESYEPGGSAPAPVAPVSSPFAASPFAATPFATEPAVDTPSGATPPAAEAFGGAPVAGGTVQDVPHGMPAPVSYPVPPSSYEMPAELTTHQPTPLTDPVETTGAAKGAAKEPKLKAPKSKAPKVRAPKDAATVKEPTLKPVAGAKGALPRWTVPALAAVVVIGAGALYLGTRGSSDTSSAPIVIHRKPVTAASASVLPVGGSAIAPATRLASAAPAGYTATGPGVPVAAAGLATADSVHRAAELAAAGVTSATATTFTGPGGVTITTLTETAASAAQATALATHARHLGFTVQASNGATVFSLHSLGNAAPVVTALTSWSNALKS